MTLILKRRRLSRANLLAVKNGSPHDKKKG